MAVGSKRYPERSQSRAWLVPVHGDNISPDSIIHDGRDARISHKPERPRNMKRTNPPARIPAPPSTPSCPTTEPSSDARHHHPVRSQNRESIQSSQISVPASIREVKSLTTLGPTAQMALFGSNRQQRVGSGSSKRLSVPSTRAENRWNCFLFTSKRSDHHSKTRSWQQEAF